MPKRYTITPLSELPLRSDFMFGQVMRSEEICKLFLEALLGIDIQRIEFLDRQKDIHDSYDHHGIRLDVYLKDDKGTIFNVEIQADRQDDLPRRVRFYQSGIDRSELPKGADYASLSESYISRPLAKLGKAVKIADASNQRKAKGKAVSAVAIAFREDAKPFDKSDNVLNKDTLS